MCGFDSSLDLSHSSWPRLYYSLCGLQNLRVPAHAQVVITAPDRHIFWGHRCLREVLGKGVCISPAIHSLEHTIGVVLFLLHDLVPEKLVITKYMVSYRSKMGQKELILNHFLASPYFIHTVVLSSPVSVYSFIWSVFNFLGHINSPLLHSTILLLTLWLIHSVIYSYIHSGFLCHACPHLLQG